MVELHDSVAAQLNGVVRDARFGWQLGMWRRLLLRFCAILRRFPYVDRNTIHISGYWEFRPNPQLIYLGALCRNVTMGETLFRPIWRVSLTKEYCWTPFQGESKMYIRARFCAFINVEIFAWMWSRVVCGHFFLAQLHWLNLQHQASLSFQFSEEWVLEIRGRLTQSDKWKRTKFRDLQEIVVLVLSSNA